jgi:aminopeptidase-like protein
MSTRALLDALDDSTLASLGVELHDLVRRLYPVPRSLTGDGVRETLRVLQEWLAGVANGPTTAAALRVHEVPSGSQAFDWTVPKEWNVREAWIKDPAGRKLADFAEHRLHLVGYSVPVRARMPLSELQEHLHSLPDRPDLVPYRTSYYAETWGFCLPHAQRAALPDGEYEVLVDATLTDGALTYGELELPGASAGEEVLLSAHVCHPQLANDNLSGLVVLAALARALAVLTPEQRRYTYRFVFVPGTIGAIVWLARNPDCARRVVHGLVAANLGGPGPCPDAGSDAGPGASASAGGFHYKRSRRGNAAIDRAAQVAMRDLGEPLEVEDFVPFGYDERQYCSPGFDLPVGALTRTPWGRYPKYHTSADDLDLVRPEALAGSVRAYLAVFAALEGDRRYRNLQPYGEPQLGRRGLYRSLGGDDRDAARARELALLWVLNQSDGERGLLDIAERSGLPMARLEEAARVLVEAGLLGS